MPSSIPTTQQSQSPTEKETIIGNRGIISDIDNQIILPPTNGDQVRAGTGSKTIPNSFILVGSLIALTALIALVFLAVTIKRRRNANRLYFTKAFQEIQHNINDEDNDELMMDGDDDLSQFNPSTIATERTSVWKKRMESVLLHEVGEGNVSVVYPQSVFNQSTIVSEGTWVRRAMAGQKFNKQPSVMDIDFFDDKPIPAHVMCYESNKTIQKEEVERKEVKEVETEIEMDVLREIVKEIDTDVVKKVVEEAERQ